MRAVHQKVTASHLSRDAYLYVRQSSLRQVFEHTEGTRRQYVLRERAVALGWPTERVVVIDSDLGLSGADGDREGFKRLVAEVSMDRAGIVLGLEVSRLARNSADWHRLLEICALSETLILDEDGVYDPVDFNDRLLLGLKGTMSEAELHMMRARLRGGSLSAAPARGVEGAAAGGAGLRPTRPSGARSRRSSAAQLAPAVRHLHSDRLGAGHSETLQQRETAIPVSSTSWATQGRTALEGLEVLAGPAGAAQPAICGRFRVRAQPEAAASRRRLRDQEHSA